MMTRLRLLLALGLLAAPPAHAEPRDDARRHFAAGLAAAQAGRFEDALAEFLAAQDAWPHPATAYNIAKAYTDLGDLPRAIEWYETCRAAAPERAADVDPVLAVLRARLARASAPPEPAPPPEPLAPVPPAPLPPDADARLQRLRELGDELAALTDALAGAPAVAAPPEGGEASAPVGEGPGAVGEAPEGAPPEGPGPDGPVAGAVGGGPAEPPEPIPDVGFREEAYERVVVTASRVGQDPLDSPSTVTVLTADDLRLSGATDVPDLLRRVVGVDVMAATGGQSDVAIRGFQRKVNNKVLVLIDGRSTYLDFIGTTFWQAFPIALEEIERIEVIRGPGSAVYGANAVTGVVNIVTRAPGEGGQVVSVDAGAPGYHRITGVTSGRAGDTGWRLSAGLQRHGRWAAEADLDRLRAPAVAPFFVGADGAPSTAASDWVRANARVDRRLGADGALSLSAGLAQGTGEFANVGALPDYGLALRHHYVRADAFAGALHLRGFWNANRGETGPWLGYVGERSLDARFDNEVVDVELEAPTTFETGRVRHQLNAGGGWRYKAIRMGYLGGGFDRPYVENHFQVFANEQATLGRLGLVGSLRIDRHPLIPLARTVSPRAAVLVRAAKRTTLRATAGSAYRAPTAIESYMDFALPTPVDGVFIRDLGNRDLRPERIATVELGVHDASTAAHQADVVVYAERVTDLVDLTAVTPTVLPYDPALGGFQVGRTGWVNEDGVATAGGLEGELELYPVDGVDLYANAALRRALVTPRPGAEARVDTSASEALVNAGGTVRTPWRTDLTLEGHFRSGQTWRLRTFDPDTLALVEDPRALDPALLVSARVAVRPIPDEDLEAAFVAWNPLASFREHPEGQPLGARWFAQAAWRFR